MKYKVFIGYSSQDNDKAQYIFACLGRIEELTPYKAELYPVYGEDFKQRIQNELHQCHFMIVLLTENGKNSQWVNQEIGFAYSLLFKRRNKAKPHIIPITHKQVDLKGFLTKDTIDFLFLDNFPSFEDVVADIIAQIRWRIPKGLEEGSLNLKLICFNCKDKKGFPFECSAKIPAQEDVWKAIQAKKYYLPYTCPNCSGDIFIDVRTLLSQKPTEG